MSDLLPAIKVEFLIQLRTHCDNRSYAIYGRTHPCGVCGPLGVPMHVEDARDVGRNHVRAVAVVAVVDDDGDLL